MDKNKEQLISTKPETTEGPANSRKNARQHVCKKNIMANTTPQNSSCHKSSAFIKRLPAFLWPLSPVLVFYLLGLIIFTAFRTALCAQNFSRVNDVENYLLIFPIGFRMDTMLLCYAMALPCLALLVLPASVTRRIGRIFSLFFTLTAGVFFFLEIATFPFMAEFDTRPDRLFLEHMVQVQEVFGMIIKGYSVSLFIGVGGALIVGWLVFRLFNKLFKNNFPCSFKKRMAMLIIAVPLIFFGIRSNVSGRPANISTAAFSKSHLVNQLGLNSTYSLGYAYYQQTKHKEKSEVTYGKMNKEEILRRVRAANALSEQACTNPEIPLLHSQESKNQAARPLNLVIVLEESMGAEHVGCLGGLPLTPNLDRLSKEGLLLRQLYATGTRTVRGIEAILSGFLPTPGESVIKLGLAQQNFFTIAELLRRRNYSTNFLYGGKSTFDNMNACFRGNGFLNIYDQGNFDNPEFTGTWGVSDEDLFIKANEIFKSQGEKPFFALVLTTSNHDPYEFPDGRIELYEQPKATRYNAIKYADYAVGRFFEMAKKEAYYKNTVFLIIADHSTRLRGHDLIPVDKFHIPGIIIGPTVQPGMHDRVASQIDMTPTLLECMGITASHPLIGRPLLSFPDSIPGRAVMQYGTTHAVMVGNEVLIQQPELSPMQFTYKDNKLTLSQLDPELAQDALAYALLPNFLYSNQLHRLPPE